jgi:hypothetical protein
MFVISHDIWCYSILSAKEKDKKLGKVLTSQYLAELARDRTGEQFQGLLVMHDIGIVGLASFTQ